MLMLNASSATKLVTLTVASFMLASSSSAAPVINRQGESPSLPAADCVKIQDDIDCSKLVPIKVDTSGCDPSLVDTTQPWTVTLVNCEHHDDTIKLADIVGGAVQKDHTWNVQVQPNTIAAFNSNVASTNSKYHIQVELITKDGNERLFGKTTSFIISKSLQKRDDDVVVTPIDNPAVPMLPPHLSTNNAVPVDNAAIAPIDNVAVPPADNAAIPEVTGIDQSQDPTQAAVNPAIDVLAVPPAILLPTVKTPDDLVAPLPTVKSPSIIDTNNGDVPNPSGPNQSKPGDPAAVQIIHEPKKRPSAGEVFFKYAGAGSAILSTIGPGLGGVVGGVVGGAAGLVIGLTAALVISLYYAPNVA
ncbi:hypothetical protein BGX33_002150 [Mortierella sp. NVP41]|nr:hypothetical protein BGX33_002150 [Mortierella sp. NVP41]